MTGKMGHFEADAAAEAVATQTLTTTPEGDLIDARGRRWVTMSNALTRAGHGLSLSEKRIIGCAVAKLDSRRALAAGEVPVTRITAAEYADTFGVSLDSAYEQLQAGAKSLFDRMITFYDAAHRRKGKDLALTKTQMRWVGEAKYQEGEGWVELYWWPRLLPHLTGLKKQFTSYQLEQASALRSAYSWRLLELLMRFETTGWAEYTIEDFHEAVDAQKSHRENFAKLRSKVIEPAVKELSEKDGWIINWHPLKKGRKVAGLRFQFGRNPQQSLPLRGR